METGKRPIDQNSHDKKCKRKENKPEELQLEVGDKQWSFTQDTDNVLGQGTFGTVTLGMLKRDGEEDKLVAVKTARQSDFREGLKRERDILNFIRQTTQCQFYLGISVSPTQLITTLAGVPLLSYLFDHKQVTRKKPDKYPIEALRVAKLTDDAFGYFKQKKILVRDVSLDNIVMLETSKGFEVKLIDVALWQISPEPFYVVCQTWDYLLDAIKRFYEKKSNPMKAYNQGDRVITQNISTDKNSASSESKESKESKEIMSNKAEILNCVVSYGALAICLLSILSTDYYLLQSNQTREDFATKIKTSLINRMTFLETLKGTTKEILQVHVSRILDTYLNIEKKAQKIIDNGHIDYTP